mmetsp:Transcript_2616/g.6139  ORF Transcript_2616/g.6139 Transcript_2616/m.6139 type:complete len:327 (-) Transcript_2616:309-1289(-)
MEILRSALTATPREHVPASRAPGLRHDKEKDAQTPPDGPHPHHGATPQAEPPPPRAARSPTSPHPHCRGCSCQTSLNPGWHQHPERTGTAGPARCEKRGLWNVATHLAKYQSPTAPNSFPECGWREQSVQHFRSRSRPSASWRAEYRMTRPLEVCLPAAEHPLAAALSGHGPPGVAFRTTQSESVACPLHPTPHTATPVEAAHRGSCCLTTAPPSATLQRISPASTASLSNPAVLRVAANFSDRHRRNSLRTLVSAGTSAASVPSTSPQPLNTANRIVVPRYSFAQVARPPLPGPSRRRPVIERFEGRECCMLRYHHLQPLRKCAR